MYIFRDTKYKKIYKYVYYYFIALIYTLLAIEFLSDKITLVFPGKSEPVSNIVSINDKGMIHNLQYLSVSSNQAGPISYFILTKIHKHFITVEGSPINYRNTVHTQKDTDYTARQSRIQSYNVAYIAASELAYKKHLIRNNVKYTKNLMFTGNSSHDTKYKLFRGDIIVSANNNDIRDITDFAKIVKENKNSDISIAVLRDNTIHNISISMNDISDSLITSYNFIDDPLIKLKDSYSDTEQSVGLATAILFYYQITNQEPLKNFLICATGTIDENGNIGQIGGIEFKTYTANKAKANILFVPKSTSFFHRNEIDAYNTAKQINSSMQIVPVKTLEEAIDFLKQLS